MLSSHWQSLRFLSLSHIFCPCHPSLAQFCERWVLRNENRVLFVISWIQNLLDTSLLHYFHVQNPVIIFRAVRHRGISFSAFIINVCSTTRFAVLRVLDNCAVSEIVLEWGITAEKFSQLSEVVWKERKSEKLDSNVQEPEIPEGKRSIGQDVVLFCN